MKLSLVVMTPGKQEGKSLDVKLAQFVIGRDPQCHLRPASPMISKRHCAILQRDNKVFLRDFGSMNGSYVNDEPVKGEIELKNNDRLKIGPLLFKVQLEAPALVSRPAPPVATRPPEKTAAVAAKSKPSAGKTPSSPIPSEGEDDDIAAMLLSIGDDDVSPAASAGGADEIPDGSTQMEILVPPGSIPEPTRSGDAAKAAKDAKDSSSAAKAAKDAKGSSANAAKSILEQMMRRPRT